MKGKGAESQAYMHLFFTDNIMLMKKNLNLKANCYRMQTEAKRMKTPEERQIHKLQLNHLKHERRDMNLFVEAVLAEARLSRKNVTNSTFQVSRRLWKIMQQADIQQRGIVSMYKLNREDQSKAQARHEALMRQKNAVKHIKDIVRR